MITKPHLHSVWKIGSAKKTLSSRYVQEELLGTRWTISLLPFGYYTSMELSRLINPSHWQQQRSSHWMISRHMRRPSPIALVQIFVIYGDHKWKGLEAKINDATYNHIALESHDVALTKVSKRNRNSEDDGYPFARHSPFRWPDLPSAIRFGRTLGLPSD